MEKRLKSAEILKKIRIVEDDMTDREFFSNGGFFNYLKSSLHALLTEVHDRNKIKLVPYYKPKNQILGRTNYDTVEINTGHQLIKNLKTRQEKFIFILGVILHEVGHILYTDFKESNIYFRRLEELKWYPKKPDGGEAIMDKLTEKKSYKNFFIEITKELNNIIEDYYIESRVTHRFPGLYSKGLRLERKIILENIAPLSVHLNGFQEGTLDMLSIVLSQLMYFLYHNDIKGREEAQDKYPEEFEKFNEVFSTIRDNVYLMKMETSSIKRFEYTNSIMVNLWCLMESILEQLEDKPEDSDSSGGAAGGESSDESSESSEEPTAGSVEEFLKALKDMLEKTSPSSRPLGKTSPIEEHGETDSSGKEFSTEDIKHSSSGDTEFNEAEEAIASYKIEKENTDGLKKEAVGIKEKREDELDKDTESLKSLLKDDKLDEATKEGLREKLKFRNSQSKCIREFTYVLHRKADITTNIMQAYEEEMIELKPISKALQKKTNRILTERNVEGKLSGLAIGKKLSPRNMFRDDGKIFSKALVPDGTPNLAICLLIDESGSMWGNANGSVYSKYEIARKTAMIVEDFLRCMKIPHLIIGHTADITKSVINPVEINLYSEFDSVDNMDKYRCAMVRAMSENRDGAALLYAYERLITRPELKKMLLVITDGQPHANNYYGVKAEEDCTQTINDYAAKGIKTVALAIDGNKSRLQRMFSPERMIDVVDVRDLPIQLTSILKREILK